MGGLEGFDPAGLVVPAAASLAASVSSALVMGHASWRRAAALALAAAASMVPWLYPALPVSLRFMLIVPASLFFLHAIDLARSARLPGALHRVWFMLTPFDTRVAKRVPPRVSGALVGGLIGWLALAVAALWLHERLRPFESPADHLVRWGLGLVGFYALVEAIADFAEQLYLAIGIAPPPIHRLPIAARTVGEFWSERWNLEIRRWLHRHAFLPLARRRRPVAAVAAAFVASTALHVWIMLPLGPPWMSVSWAAFFLLQGVIVILEYRLGVAAWRPAIGRVWAIGWLVLTSPLFLEPMLRVFPG